jgi:hypothetical protein
MIFLTCFNGIIRFTGFSVKYHN